MPKIVVTDKLADTIKMMRMQNGIKSKDLAEHLGKTPGYVSKLEKQIYGKSTVSDVKEDGKQE